jgi:hypothetical protein
MYAARKRIQELSGKPLNGQYFNQTLLPSFMRDYPELTKDWDIIWDDRGHFEEPHTGVRIGIGTAAVRDYLRDQDPHVYGSILFIEKEGFDVILRAARLQERYDLAIMSSKGMSTTAARTLIEECSREQVKIFCLHDFDVSGFTILATSSRDTQRYAFEHEPEVIDIGLRLSDVLEMNLESEEVEIKDDPIDRLARDGATPDEVTFLRGTTVNRNGKIRFKGQRVELNAMTNPQLIEFVERKLKEHGVKKVIPDEPTLQIELRACVSRKRVTRKIREIERQVAQGMKSFKMPKNLRSKVTNKFEQNATLSWRDAIGALAK